MTYFFFLFLIYLHFACWFQLVDQDVEGLCNSECKTIERACQEVSSGLSIILVIGLLIFDISLVALSIFILSKLILNGQLSVRMR